MAQVNAPIVNFSGGIIGRKLQNRVDIKYYPRAASIMENFRPDPQGTMSRRPPLEYIDTLRDSNKKAYQFPFVFNTAQSYNIVATEDGLEFFIQDGKVTLPTVSAVILDGGFGTASVDRIDAASLSASSTAAGNVNNVSDEDSSTYWQSNTDATATLTADLGSPYVIYDVWVSARSSTGTGAPTEFSLEGSNTGAFGGEEVELMTASGGAWNANEKRKYRVASPGAYRYYRLVLSATAAGTGSYVISELSMFSSPWVDNSTGTGSINLTGGLAYLDSDGSVPAVMEQLIQINEIGTTHVLKFDVVHGPVNIAMGATSGGYELLDYKDLETGTHYLEFTPQSGTVYLQFYHDANAGRILDNVSILGGPDFLVSHPWTEQQLAELKWQKIGDTDRMVFCHPDVRTRLLERRGHRSWSVVELLPDDGPYQQINTSQTQISSSAVSGEVTLTASDDVFDASDAGNIISLTYAGQTVTTAASSDEVFTDAIKVTGDGSESRTFRIIISGTFSAIVTLQRSSGNENNFSDEKDYNTAVDVNRYDARDNQTWYYRLAIKSGNYTSGTVTMTLEYGGGTSDGVVKIIAVNSPTEAVGEVKEGLGYTGGVKLWKKGAWNAEQGYPSCCTMGFGRLWLGRGATVWGSVSDDFTSFEPGEEDDKLVSRTLTSGSSRGMRWMAYLSHLVIGSQTAEHIGLQNTTSEAVSNSNFKTDPATEEGVADLQPVKAGSAIVYVHRNLRQVQMFMQDPQALSSSAYVSVDVTELAPELLSEEVVKIAVQQEPQRRIYVVLKSGKCVELLFRPDIDTRAWSLIETDGRIEDVNVIPQEDNDQVYFIVRRKIGGSWVRFIEKLGPEEEDTDNDEDLYFLDSALRLDLTRPDVVIEVSGKTGTVTILADEDVFTAGDVGKILWVKKGKATIASYVSAREITATFTLDPFKEDDSDNESFVVSGGQWGYGAEVNTLSGLDHLEGESVRVYGDMTDLGTFTVSGGSISLGRNVSVAFAGIPFRSRYKSLKLSYGGQKGTALAQPKAVKMMTAILYRCGATLKYGPRFDKLRPINTRTSDVPWGQPVPLFTGEKEMPFDAVWSKDPRLAFECDGPAPATISGVIPQVETRDR